MKRDDIKAIFPDATQEQLDQLMKIYGEDVNKAKEGVSALQAQLAEAQQRAASAPSADSVQAMTAQVAQLQAQLEQITQANQLRDLREGVAKEKGVPAELLFGTTAEECNAQADKLLAFATPKNPYPNLPDGGEKHPAGGSTRDQFAAWVEATT